MEQFDSSEEASSRVLEQQQRNDEQQCPSCAAELIETSVWTTGRWTGHIVRHKSHLVTVLEDVCVAEIVREDRDTRCCMT